MIKERVTFRKLIYKGIRSRTGVFYFALSHTHCLAVIRLKENILG